MSFVVSVVNYALTQRVFELNFDTADVMFTFFFFVIPFFLQLDNFDGKNGL